MKLSKRLETVASFVKKGSSIADVGTDHGYIPIALMERGWARRENDCGELRSRLLALRDLQELLFEEGRALKRQIRDQLNQSKEQMRRMRGYGQAVGQAMR